MVIFNLVYICIYVNVLYFYSVKCKWNRLDKCVVPDSYNRIIIISYVELDRGNKNPSHCSKRGEGRFPLHVILRFTNYYKNNMILGYVSQVFFNSGSLHRGVGHCSKRITLICLPVSTADKILLTSMVRNCRHRALMWNGRSFDGDLFPPLSHSLSYSLKHTK